LRDVTLPAAFTKLASRLGGKNPDLPSHANVAFRTIRAVWPQNDVPWTARQALVGALLENLCKERPIGHVRILLRTFVTFGQGVLGDNEFLRYLDDWAHGHFISPEVLSLG
jgi:hypothetical protein